MASDREPKGEITRLLSAYRQGEEGSFDRLMHAVYPELQGVARRQLRRSFGNTLDTAGLVHEAYLKLVDRAQASLQDRAHFFGIAANAMRQILVDHARRRLADKRGGGAHHTELDDDLEASRADAAQVLGVHRALERMADLDERLTRVVECLYFAGLTRQETADTLGISLSTVERAWRRAKAWLREEMAG